MSATATASPPAGPLVRRAAAPAARHSLASARAPRRPAQLDAAPLLTILALARRHPTAPSLLQHRKWTYWELRAPWKKGAQKQNWAELPIALFDFDTVEDFWIA